MILRFLSLFLQIYYSNYFIYQTTSHFHTPRPKATCYISQIHEVKSGSSVGYNRGFIATQKTRTATLPLGHADGIGRHYGNGKGAVWIHGQKAPILGNVCMDMIMVDVSSIDCTEGDEAIVFGGKNQNAEAFAEQAGTISYEILTAISQRVRRVIIDN